MFMVGICAALPASAEDLHVCSTVAFKAVAEATGKAFSESENLKIAYHFGPAGPVSKRVSDGEACDVVLLATPVLRQLAADGRIDGEVRALAQTRIGIAGLPTASPLVMNSPDDFVSFLRSHGPVGMTDPSNGGAVSVYIAGLLAKPEFPADLKNQIRWFPSGSFPKSLENGEVKYWITQVSEIVPAKTVRLLAGAPPSIQSATVISGALATQAKSKEVGNRFLAHIRGSVDVLKSFGMTPGT